ncbi:hypothetical protein DL240_04110 [Lujinxingia litoralis]|uniref:Uncharacterized protein n=1 Tax=Lujinxingia litoralis TaxID=2211119 RepID=A0A328CEL9_9DELT|nr:hypothetical protein [Lujinxingia litoralis]RAL25403.1 hypothetical protein DL240_04110 [Lujinxingia litoralis]
MHFLALIALSSAAAIEPHCPTTFDWPRPAVERRWNELLPTLSLSVTTAAERTARFDAQARDPMAAFGGLHPESAIHHARERRPSAWFLSASWHAPGAPPAPAPQPSIPGTPSDPSGPDALLQACLTLVTLDDPAAWLMLAPDQALDHWMQLQVLRTWLAGVPARGGAQ